MSETNENPASDAVSTDPNNALSWRVLLAGRNPKVTLIRAAVLATVCFVIFKFVLLPARVTGASMEPTYRNGGVNLINRLAYMRSKPARGDVVGVKFTGSRVQLFKRVVALPGETFAIRRGVVYIDGQPLSEPYTTANLSWTTRTPPEPLPSGMYVVIGDNRTMDMNLHEWGKISSDRIVGKAVF